MHGTQAAALVALALTMVVIVPHGEAGVSPADALIRLRGGRSKNNGFGGQALRAAEREAKRLSNMTKEEILDEEANRPVPRKLDIDELKVQAMRNIGDSLRRCVYYPTPDIHLPCGIMAQSSPNPPHVVDSHLCAPS